MKKSFDVEKVTKKFYDRFKKEREAFQKFIDGIPDKDMELWYVSVMLNRLMFIYFIQKKRFLNGDKNYLSNRLDESRKRGDDQFYTQFLCPLFFKGFAERKEDRSDATNRLLGDIPYLNGSIFLKHQIEKLHGKDIWIPDKAFVRLLDFFEEYEWHLDDRPVRKGNEINPDVLGYIFEKYVNQKQMGAYYTKEDITEYISKNTILPWLLDRVKGFCEIAFEGKKSVWNLLQDEPDRYIYDAIKHGMDYPLPEDIAAGIKDVSKRTGWNVPAPAEFALPTEIWREVVARRQRYEEVWTKMADGEISEVNDLITYNLDIRQFVQDVIESSEGPELIRSFWKALHGDTQNQGVSILDPTCGSGAFLFAALNILEPLYEACLEKMQEFLDSLPADAAKKQPGKYKDFRDELKRIDSHPNRTYFILKSIIVNNLYGVDIMEEAVEICKLRLFLKLVSQIEDADRIEPLPDIDFNIRAGNTLVGYATREDVKHAGEGKLDFGGFIQRIEKKASDVDRAFKGFSRMQVEGGYTGSELASVKEEVSKGLSDLNEELNQYLADDYGIAVSKKKEYQQWLESHQPFHWFVDFYGIMRQGGFDVIIGNPPYVEYSKVKPIYTITSPILTTGNLYSLCFERFIHVANLAGYIGIIVPISSVSTPRMESLQDLLVMSLREMHISNFAVRPDKLFIGADMNLTIFIGNKAEPTTACAIQSTQYIRWYKDFRPFLFPTLSYSVSNKSDSHKTIPKLGNSITRRIFDILNTNPQLINYMNPIDSEEIYYHSGGRYFRKCIRKKLSNEYKSLKVKTGHGDAYIGLLSSSLYYWFWIVISDCYHVIHRDIETMTAPEEVFHDALLNELAQKLLIDLWDNAEVRMRHRADGSIREEVNFNIGKSMSMINKIDFILSTHYGFTDEELDFIINYDIKYRMGNELRAGAHGG